MQPADTADGECRQRQQQLVNQDVGDAKQNPSQKTSRDAQHERPDEAVSREEEVRQNNAIQPGQYDRAAHDQEEAVRTLVEPVRLELRDILLLRVDCRPPCSTR